MHDVHALAHVLDGGSWAPTYTASIVHALKRDGGVEVGGGGYTSRRIILDSQLPLERHSKIALAGGISRRQGGVLGKVFNKQ